MRQTTTRSQPRLIALGHESLQVAASPCWALAFPDGISSLLLWVLGPVPRLAPPVHSRVSSRTTSASPQSQQVRRPGTSTTTATSLMATVFGAAGHSLLFRLPYWRGLQGAPTAPALEKPEGSQAVSTTQRTCGYPTRTVASLPIRIEQWIWRDFHPLDGGLVGRYSRPRWCPGHSPFAPPGLLPSGPLHAVGFLLLRRIILLTTTLHISGLNTRPGRLIRPASDSRFRACPWTSLPTCWLDVSQVGLGSRTRTHWVTLSNFMGFHPVPSTWIYLGTSSAWLDADPVYVEVLRKTIDAPANS